MSDRKKSCNPYDISLNLFGASGLGRAGSDTTAGNNRFITRLYEKTGNLVKFTTSQFYDAELVFFSMADRWSDNVHRRLFFGKGYADECSLGHHTCRLI